MAKRATSLILALVMAVLCVPVFALSVFAAAPTPKTHTTSWRENMPATTDDPASIGYLVEYPENAAWFIGSLNRDSFANFIPFNYHTADHLNLICGNIWPATDSDRWTGDQWTNGGFYIEDQAMITPPDRNTTVRYVAEYTGTATVSVTKLYFALRVVEGITDGEPNHAFAIFQNGTMVWPTEGGSYTDFTDWRDPKVADADVSGDIKDLTLSLHAGDALDFVFAYDRDKVTKESVRGAYDFDATVAYTSITEELFGSIKTVYADDVMFWQDTRYPLTYMPSAEATAPAFPSPEAYGEYLEKFMTVRYDGNWSLGVMLGNTGKYEPLARRMFFATRKLNIYDAWDTAWGVTESYFQQQLASYLAGNEGNVWGDYSGSSHESNVCLVQPSQPWTAVTYAYRVPADGVLSLRFEEISPPTNPGGMRVCVLVDGYMVWPTNGGTLGDKSNQNYKHWYPIEQNAPDGFLTTLNDSLKEVQPYVTAGSLVEFCVGKASWAGSASGNGYKVNPALTLSPDASGKRCVVTYADADGKVLDRYECQVGKPFPQPSLLGLYDLNGDGTPDTLPKTVSGSVAAVAVELLGKDVFSASVPTINATSDGADFHGNWTIGKGTWSKKGTWDKDALTSPGATWDRGLDFTKYDGYAFVAEDAILWDEKGGGMYPYRKFAARLVSSQTGIGAIYKAPYSGTVDLSFAELIGRRELSNNADQAGNPNMGGLSLPIAYYVSILKNGEVVWPRDASAFLFATEDLYTSELTDGNYYTNTSVDADFLKVPLQKEAPAWPTNLKVKAGDEIAFIVNQGNVACWMCYMDPVVSYTSVDTSGAVVESASITLGDAFAVNYYLTSPQADITEMGVELEDGTYLPGEKQEDDTWKVTVGGIAARELVDSILVTPIAKKSTDAEWRGMSMSSSPAELLKAYVTEDSQDKASNLAIATLNYAAAAQTYFGYKTDTLANADLTEAQKVTATGTYKGHYKITPMEDANGKVFRLHGMTLLLEDTVSLKLLATEAGLLDSGAYYVRLTANDMKPSYVRLVPCEGEGSKGTYKAIFEGLTPLAWDTAYTLTICDGNDESAAEVSASVTYSVTTYAVRTKKNAAVKPVTDAMLALYEAALAYAAPQNPGE